MKEKILTLLFGTILLISIISMPVKATEKNWYSVDGVVGGRVEFDKSTGTITDFEENVTIAVIPKTIDGVDVSFIGNSAFWSCNEKLEKVVIPEGVDTQGQAMMNCNNLNTAGPIGSGCDYEFGWTKSIPEGAFYSCEELVKIELPSTITSIGDVAFAECEKLVQIELPESVEVIGSAAFSDCRSLSEVEIPEGVKKLEYATFYGCSSLRKIDLASTISIIDESVFYRCSSLTEIELPSQLKSIEREAFMYCDGLKKIEIPSGTESIKQWAFAGCSELAKVIMPSSVNYMSLEVFGGCGKLISAGPIGSGCDYEFGWVESIPYGAFMTCRGLTRIELPKTITTIGSYAFSECSGLAEIKLPESLISIGDGVFEECNNLTEIELPQNVTRIGEHAFVGCENLEKLVIPASVNFMSDGRGVFSRNKKLTSAGPIGSGCDYEFGWTKNIPAHAFDGCTYLTEIKLPGSLKSIGRYAFRGCGSISEFVLPSGLTRIEDGTFYGCEMSEIEIPNGVTYIGEEAFGSCNNLKLVVFPESVQIIDEWIFSYLDEPNEINVVFKGDLPEFSRTFYTGWDEQTITAYYPAGNDTWTADKLQSHSKTVRWVPYTGEFPQELLEIRLLSATIIPSNKSGIIIRDGITGKALKGVSVKIGSETFKTDEEGKVLTNLSGKQTVSVTIGDNIKVRSTQKTLEHGKFIIITVATDNSTLWVASADIEIDSETFDLMDSVFYLTHKTWDEKKATEKGLKKAKFVLQVQANGEPKKYQLIQNNEIVQENYDGCFEFGGYIDSSKKDTVYYTDGLKSGYAVYVKVYDIDGKIAKQCLGLKIAEASSLEIKNNILNGSVKQEFSLGNKLKVTVPNEIPLIGGGTLDLGIMKDCPIKMSMDEDGMVKVAVNMGEFDTGDTGAWYQVKEDYEKLSKRALKLSNSAAAFGGTPQSFGGGMFEVKASVAGYGEGYLSEIKDGRLKVNVGLIVEASAEKTFTKYAFIYFVPVYINFGGGVELESKGLTYLQYENSKFSVEGGNLEIEPEIYAKLKGGVGAEDLLDVYASGKLGFSYLYRFAKNYQRLSMTGDAEVGLNVWIYNKPMLEINDTWVLYDSNRKNVSSSIATMSANTNTNYADFSNAEIISNDYLMKRNGMVRMMRARGNTSESALILDYAFQNASPKLLKTEDALYLFYLDGVTGRAVQNQTALFYQKSTDGGVSWSSAVRVDDNANETADYNYDAVVSGNDVYVVWSDAGSVYGDEFLNLDSEDGIHQITKEMNLMLAHIDGNTGNITTRVLKTEQADLQPHIMADEEGNVHVAWFSNDVSSEEGMFSVNNGFKLLYASSAQDYEITEMVLPVGSYPLSLDMGVLNDKISVAVNLDVDQELSTQEDRELYLWNPEQNQGLVQLTANEVIDSVPKFASVAGEESIFWYQNGNVVYTSDGEEIHNIFTEEHPADIGQEFEVLEGADGKAAIVWTVTSLENERGIELYCSDFDGSDWSVAYKLSNLNSEFTSKLSGYLSGDDYRIAYLGRKAEDSNIHAGIYLIKPEERVDTVIGYSMEGNGQAGEVYPITLNVENTGNTTITELIVDGEIDGFIENLNIAPGTTEIIVYKGLFLPSRISGVYNSNLTVKAPEESDIENNIVPISVGHPDFEVSASMDYSGGCYLASLAVTNNGIMQSDAILKVYSDEELTKMVYKTEIPAVASGESRALVLNVDALDKTAESFYFVVSDKNRTEIHLEDNSSIIYVGKGNSKEDKNSKNNVVRIAGDNRYETGYKAANALKEKLGVDKFDAVIIATGKNFADALSGSYLAVTKNAPILLTDGKAAKVEVLHDYIKENLKTNGTIYILGGISAVPANVAEIDGYTVERLEGDDRYETNLKILKEAGITGNELIVATGKDFADCLSASATGKPILLVNPKKTLNDEQKAIVKMFENGKVYIIGGESAVNKTYENELAKITDVKRVFGKNRRETSIKVAETFFKDAKTAVVAYAKNYPDGLCGGPLAAAMNAPLLLTQDGKTTEAAGYVATNNIFSGYVLGGNSVLTDEPVVEVFALGSVDEIVDYKEGDEDTEQDGDMSEIEEESTYKVYWCRRKITLHGSSDSPVYYYRSPETTEVTDPGWDKCVYETQMNVLGYIESDTVGRRYIVDIRYFGTVLNEVVRYYIPEDCVTENEILHTYGNPNEDHPHRKYCDCGDSVTANFDSCQICRLESGM